MKNQLKTVALLGVLTAILLWIGSFWGEQGIIIGFLFAVIMNFGSYWFSDKIVLKMYGAQEVDEKSHPELMKMVRNVAELANLPMPRVYVIPQQQPNAFATGRNPKHAAVAYTQGILQALNKKELRGVTAHELAHVNNRDILITSIAATIAGVISYVALIARWGAIFGFGRGGDDGGNILELLVLAIITPIVATIIQLAISRSREFLADEKGAKFINDSQGLASALQKLENYSKRVPMRSGSEVTSSLFIVNPFSGKAMSKLFSTHPSTEERVKKLRDLGF